MNLQSQDSQTSYQNLNSPYQNQGNAKDKQLLDRLRMAGAKFELLERSRKQG